jgi:hypothetical protein
MLTGAGRGASVTGFAASLLTNLVGFWKLEEASGTRDDAYFTNDLTDNNTVGQAAGQIGNAASFVRANSESLSLSDHAGLDYTDFTVACWVNLTTAADWMALISKWHGGSNLREFALFYSAGSSRYRLEVSGDGSSTTAVNASTFGLPPTATWHFVVAWHDAAADTIYIQVNNGTVDSAAHAAGAFNSTAGLRLGAIDDPGDYHNGLLDAVGFWSRVLTSDERDYLYNSGTGREHPFT